MLSVKVCKCLPCAVVKYTMNLGLEKGIEEPSQTPKEQDKPQQTAETKGNNVKVDETKTKSNEDIQQKLDLDENSEHCENWPTFPAESPPKVSFNT